MEASGFKIDPALEAAVWFAGRQIDGSGYCILAKQGALGATEHLYAAEVHQILVDRYGATGVNTVYINPRPALIPYIPGEISDSPDSYARKAITAADLQIGHVKLKIAKTVCPSLLDGTRIDRGY